MTEQQPPRNPEAALEASLFELEAGTGILEFGIADAVRAAEAALRRAKRLNGEDEPR